jgi:hypothetical protein
MEVKQNLTHGHYLLWFLTGGKGEGELYVHSKAHTTESLQWRIYYNFEHTESKIPFIVFVSANGLHTNLLKELTNTRYSKLCRHTTGYQETSQQYTHHLFYAFSVVNSWCHFCSWVVAPCGCGRCYLCFEGTCCIHFQGRNVFDPQDGSQRTPPICRQYHPKLQGVTT